jgi:PAS domain S-box-containing protein
MQNGETQQTILQSIIDNTPAAVYLKNPQGEIVVANQGLGDILGLDRRELIGKTSYDFYPRETAEEHIANDREIMESGESNSFEEVIPGSQPEDDRTFLSVKFPVTDPDGAVIGVGGVSTEITERKQAEAALHKAHEGIRSTSEALRVANRALRQKEERFAALFYQSPNPAFTFDASNETLLEVNDAFCDLVRHNSERLLGRTLAEAAILSAEDRETLSLALAAEGSARNLEVTFHPMAGEPLDVVLSAARLDFDGRQVIICSGTEITTRKRVEEQLRNALVEKDDLMAELNHRVKNNLTMVSSLVNLKELSLGEGVNLSDIRSRLDAFITVHDMLSRSRGTLSIPVQPYLEELLETLFRASGGRVEVKVDAGDTSLPAKEAVTVGLIINEIATNAIKYSLSPDSSGGFTVTLEELHASLGYVLTARSTGRPIPPEVTLDYGGSLGLRLIHSLGQQLGGSVELIHDPPGYRIEFPAPVPAPVSRPAPVPAPAPGPI